MPVGGTVFADEPEAGLEKFSFAAVGFEPVFVVSEPLPAVFPVFVSPPVSVPEESRLYTSSELTVPAREYKLVLDKSRYKAGRTPISSHALGLIPPPEICPGKKTAITFPKPAPGERSHQLQLIYACGVHVSAKFNLVPFA